MAPMTLSRRSTGSGASRPHRVPQAHEQARATAAASVSSSGSSCVSMSMNVSAMRNQVNASAASAVAAEAEAARPRSADSMPVSELHQRIARADRRLAVRALAAQQQPAHHRNVLQRRDRRLADGQAERGTMRLNGGSGAGAVGAARRAPRIRARQLRCPASPARDR